MQNKYLRGGGIRDKWIKTAAQQALATVEAELTGVRDIVNQNRNDWLNFRSVLIDARMIKLDNLDAKISTRAPANTALSTAVWTNARAGYLDKINTNLDAKISEVKTIANNALTKAEAARVAAVDAGTKATAINTSIAGGALGFVPKKYLNNFIEKTSFQAGEIEIFNINGKGRITELTLYMSSINAADGKGIINIYIDGNLIFSIDFGTCRKTNLYLIACHAYTNVVKTDEMYFSKSFVAKYKIIDTTFLVERIRTNYSIELG